MNAHLHIWLYCLPTMLILSDSLGRQHAGRHDHAFQHDQHHNITTPGYTSPFESSIISFGVLDSKHTTTAQPVYNYQTVLTPWPYITADVGLSFLMALWTLLASCRSPRRYDSSKTSIKDGIIDIGRVIIATIRSISLCVSAVQAISGHGGQFTACTAIVISWMSMSTFQDGSTKNWFLSQIMSLNSWLMTVIIQIMVWPAIVPKNEPHPRRYGELFISGGNCAFAARECPSTFYKVGCGLDNPAYITNYWSYRPFDFNGSTRFNTVANVEPFLGLVMTVGGSICLLPLYKAFWVHWHNRGTARDTDRIQSLSRRTAIVRMVFLLIFGGISLAMHYTQQVQPGSVYIIDSYGPLVDKDKATTSWTDCFVVPIVRDQLGFFHAWWQQVKPHPADWLSVT